MLRPDRPVFPQAASAPKLGGPAGLTPEQLLAVRQFVARVGGLENARKALAMLVILSRAA